jgi:hypothetical protein
MTDQAFAPMNIREVIEVMKILGPFSHEFTDTEKPLKIMRKILGVIQRESPVSALRLIALMEHKKVEAVADEMKFDDGIDLIERLTRGFAMNDLPLMIDAGFYIGISTTRWSDGR